jgi:hypothetical protein
VQPGPSSGEPGGRKSRRPQAVLATATGLFCSWALWQSFINHSGFIVPTWTMPVVVIGCVVLPIALSRTGLVERLARPNQEFWGGGPLTLIVIAASLYGCVAIAWGILVITMFGTRGQPQ